MYKCVNVIKSISIKSQKSNIHLFSKVFWDFEKRTIINVQNRFDEKSLGKNMCVLPSDHDALNFIFRIKKRLLTL